MKSFLHKQIGEYPLALQHLCASTITGLICDILTNPLWVVRTRLQVQHMHKDSQKYSEGLIKTMRKNQTRSNFILQFIIILIISFFIIKQEGYKALYKGLGASILGLTHVAVYFPIYEYMKIKFEEYRRVQNSILRLQDIFIASIFSKSIACTITYPHIVIRTRYKKANELMKINWLQDNRQDYASLDKQDRLKIKTIINKVIQKEGVIGLYRGLKVDLVRVLPANTITFVVYEYCKTFLEGNLKQKPEKMY